MRGDVMIGADGIHSLVREHFYPNQGSPSWNGIKMWRGAIEWPRFLDGDSMIIAGGMQAKLVLYPIAEGSTPNTRLTNWVVNVRIGDPAKPPQRETWSRNGRFEDVLPFARRFSVPGVDVIAAENKRRTSSVTPCHAVMLSSGFQRNKSGNMSLMLCSDANSCAMSPSTLRLMRVETLIE